MAASSSNSQRASIWEWAQTLILIGNLAWTTLCLGGYRPETMVVTSALNALLLAVHLAAWSLRSDGRKSHAAGWWLLPFLAYAAANVRWISPVPWLGWKDWLEWAQLILVFWVVLNGIRATATRTALVGGLAAIAFVDVVLGCYQRFVKPDWLAMGRTQADQFVGRASGSFGIPNSLAALLLLLIPLLAGLALRRRSSAVLRILAGYLALVFVFGLVLTISRGAVLALALVLTAWPVLGARGSGMRRLGYGALAVSAVAMALAALYFGLPKVRERFVQMRQDAGEKTRPIMWHGAWQIFREHRAFGGGAGSFNVLFEKFRPEKYQDEPVWAHNDYLNTLSDYGAVGFALFFVVAAGIAWRCARSRDRAERDWLDERKIAGALTAGLVAFALQLFVDFHFKIPALAMAFAVVAALLVQRSWPAPVARSRARGAGNRGVNLIGPVAGLIAVVGAMLAGVTPYYRAESLRYSARQAVNRTAGVTLAPEEQNSILRAAAVDLERATQISTSNAQAWSDRSYVLSLAAHAEPTRIAALGHEAAALADRALAISPVVPEFWLRRGVALDMEGDRRGGGAALAQALKLAPANSTVWYYWAFHLAQDKADPALALAAVDFCLRLDPGSGAAQALRQRLATAQRTP